MNIRKVIVFLFLIIASSVSIASAQLQISMINRGIISRQYYADTDDIYSSAWERSLELGEFSASVELPVGDGVLTSSQNTLATNDDFTQASTGGHLEVSIVQPAIDFPNGLDSSSYVELVSYSPFVSDYILSGVVSGPGQASLTIYDWDTSEVISSESWAGTDFSASGQLPPGMYFYLFELLDYVYGDESVSRYSECDFDLVMDPQMPVATDGMSFGEVKALYR